MTLFKKKEAENKDLGTDLQKEPKAPKVKAPKEPIDKKSLINGSYAMAVTAIIVAAVVIINFIVGTIPTKFTKFDISYQKLFTIGDTTKTILNDLQSDVTINWLTQTGSEDTTIEKLLDTYSGQSSHVKVNKVDIVAEPTFYKAYTSSSPTANSLIVVSGDKSKVISYNDIYEYDSSGYSYSATGFDGEGQITSAINYVTSTDSTKVYYTTGHGEFSLSTDMTNTLSKANIESSELNLLNTDIPDDCSCLIIFSPTTDFTAEESAKVTAFLGNGGHALICSLTSKDETPNFDSILSAYGVSRVSGFIVDPDASHYTQAQYLLMPNISSSSGVASGLTSLNLVYAYAQGLTVTDNDSATYTVTPILTTSDQAYSKSLDSTSLNKEDGDQAQQYDLAVQIEETFSNDSSGASDVSTDTASTASDASVSTASGSTDSSAADTASSAKETKILYYTTPCVFSADALSSLLQQQVSLPSGNTALFSNSITYLTDKAVTVSIASKSLDTPKITVPAAAGSIIGNVAMLLIPAAILVAGVIILVRRRSR
ncbi:MAG TPA: GldG family protein [Lachnospiraceae bacterium]|nr:GldG family protein [Lachnospiraceae bacterium]